MQFVADEGFVIKRKNYGEADRLLTIFTKENGKITAIAKGVRRITSRRGALLEPFNLIKFNTVQSYSMKVLTEVELKSSFEDIKKDLNGYKKILIACELIDTLCAEEVRLVKIYHDLLDFACDSGRYASLLDFKTDLLVNLGYWNNDRKFATDDDSYRFIESIIEKRLKSRTIKF